MRIRNNTMALNTHRMYTGNNSAIAKSAEKLSSGYRVNRAGDDAAGLAISEKMRAQVRGLSMASKNSSDAISMVQTAEGALQEVHSMLQRMNELAVQAASDTNVTIDRDALQLEFQNLQQEIDQISQTTKFNDTVLLDGSLGSGAAQGGTMEATGTLTAPTNIAADTATTGAKHGGISFANLDMDMIKEAAAQTINEEGEYTIKFEVNATDNTKVDIIAESKADPTQKGIIGSATMQAAPDNNGGAVVNIAVTGVDGQNLGTIDVTGTNNAGDADATAAKMAELVANAGATGIGDLTIAAAGAAAPAAAAAPADLTGTLALNGADTANFTVAGPAGKSVTVNALDGDGGGASVAASFDADGNLVVDIKGDNGNQITQAAIDQAIADAITAAGNNAPEGADQYSVTLDGGDITLTADTVAAAGTAVQVPAADNNQTTAGNAAVIQVGAEAGHTLNISIEAITTTGLGIAEGVVKINGATAADARTNASAAITATRAAINQVSTQRAQLGAMQNRLEYKINNLDTTTENLQAAESRIRDTDMAKEMSEFTKNNILSQAATAMLAQANAAPQNVLQLLG